MWLRRIVWLACALAASAHAAPKPSVAEIAIALNGSDADAAARAATALGARTEPAAHAALIDALAWGVTANVAEPALAAVAARPVPGDVGVLVHYAAHRNAAVRAAALGALALYPDPAAQAAIADALHDGDAAVRTAAAAAAVKGHVRAAIDPLLALLAFGDDSAARALAQLADPQLVRRIGDQLGKVPGAALARCLGGVLARADFGPDSERVEVVRVLAKIEDPAADRELAAYIEVAPKQSAARAEAQKLAAQRAGGAK